MSEKRFENRLDKSNVKFNTLNPVWDNEKEDAINVFEMIDLLNKLAEENEKLKSENDDMRFLINNISAQRDEFHRGARENANRVGKLKKENEKLKKEIEYWKKHCITHGIAVPITWGDKND